MTEQPLRRIVKPAHAGACIPDPAHPGLDLAPDGTEVVWDHHWIARERRGEVVVVEAPADLKTSGKTVSAAPAA